MGRGCERGGSRAGGVGPERVMPTLKLAVSELRGCQDEQLIETTIRSVPGVYGVTANCAEGFVEIDFEDDEVGPSELRERIAALGFTVTLIG